MREGGRERWGKGNEGEGERGRGGAKEREMGEGGRRGGREGEGESLILTLSVGFREWVNLAIVSAWHLVLTSLLHRQRYIVFLL